MNRRTLIRTLAVIPFAPEPPRGSRVIAGEIVNSNGSIADFRAGVFLTNKLAEDYRRTWAQDPFGGVQGEWYVDSRRPVKLAPLPGSGAIYETTVGVAAVKGTITVGAFRRESFTLVVHVAGTAERNLHAIGTWFAELDLPDHMPALLVGTGLRSLIPPGEVLS